MRTYFSEYAHRYSVFLITDDKSAASHLLSYVNILSVSELSEREEIAADILLLDIESVGEKSVSLLESLRCDHPELQIAIVGKFTDRELWHRIVNLRVDACLHKPIDRNELLDVLNRMAASIDEKRTFATLRKSCLHLSEAQEIARMGSFEFRFGGGPLILSDQLCKILEIPTETSYYSVEELFEKHLHPDDYESLKQHRHELLERRSRLTFEARLLSGSGEQKYVKIYCHPYYDGAGNPIRGYGLVHDITREKETEQSLKRLEMQFKAIFEGAGQGIIVADAQSKNFSFVNEKICTMLGYTQDEMVLMSPLQIHPPEALPEILDIFDRQSLGEITDTLELPMLCKDGRIFIAECNVTRLKTEHHRYLIGFFKDITHRIEAQKEIHILRNAIDQSSAIVMLIDTEGKIQYVNPEFSSVTGYLSDEVIGQHFTVLDSESEQCSLVWETLKRGEVWNGQLKKKKKNGELYTEEVRIAPVMDDERNITMFVKIAEDVTEMKEIEDELVAKTEELAALNQNLERKVTEQVEQIRVKDNILHRQSKTAQMGEMLNMIAHQWRQPLNALSASAIGLAWKNKLQMLSKEDIEEHTAFVQEHTQKMSKTINDFMNFFKPETEKVLIDFKEVMDDIVSLMGAQLASRGIQLTWRGEGANDFYSYKKEIIHILINLIANARDAYESRREGEKRIDVLFKSASGLLVIEVSDHAGGIPEIYLDSIFNPYFTTKEQGKGTGIGLYMSRRIATEVLNGSLDVLNRDNGACFTLTMIKKKGD
jgi:PAS domain S-box-containing protein